MSAGIWFWIIYVLCLVFGLFAHWPMQPSPESPSIYSYRPVGWVFVIMVLFGLLGWGVFGPPIR